jgi:hypothetical protein
VGRLAPRRAALAGWLFGLGWLVSSLWWLYISMHDFGGLAPPLAGAAVLLLAAFLSLYLAAAMAAVAAGAPASRPPMRCSTPAPGCWPSWPGPAGSPAFPGRRRAMPTPTACWRRWRPGWASMA